MEETSYLQEYFSAYHALITYHLYLVHSLGINILYEEMAENIIDRAAIVSEDEILL